MFRGKGSVMKNRPAIETPHPMVSMLALALSLVMTLAVILATGTLVNAQEPAHVAINEFMASNGQTMADEDGDFSDWIELYNSSDQSVALAGFGLSDNLSSPFRWVFPDIELESGGYLLVWASGKDRTNPGSPLHTNFSISAGGEPLLLSHPTQGLLDQVGAIAVPRDISYGRQPNGAGDWYFFDQATPGSSNNSSPAYNEVLDQPVFSHQAGFYTGAFDLTLSSAAPGVEIIYTLDGSVPDTANLSGRTFNYKNNFPRDPGDPFGPLLTESYRTWRYAQPLAITDRSMAPDRVARKSSTFDYQPSYFPQQPVFKGTVVRAQAIKPGALSSPVSTHTFFVTPAGRSRYSLPVVALSIPEDTLFDYQSGIYTAGVDFDSWRTANPTEPATASSRANWYRRGDAYEFRAHIELVEPGSPAVAFRQDIGLRVHGNVTRSYRMKSLRLYARSDYGASTFAYPIFPDQPYDYYRRLVLRNSGNDFGSTMLRDAAIQAMVAHLNVDTQAYRPAVVFINGEYWGLHNIRERYDKHYLQQVYGIDPDNIDLLESYGEVVEGDAAHYNAMLGYIHANGLAGQAHYDYIRTQMDVVNFADYQIAHIFARNTDWPGNNIEFWRLKTGSYQPNAPYGHDGRWRWLLFDTDFGFGFTGGPVAYTHDTLAFATQPGGTVWPNPDWSTFVLRELLANQEFRQYFISRFADLLNTAFLPSRTVSIITALRANVEPEMAEHIARWQAPVSMSLWSQRVNTMVDFAFQRPQYQRQHIRDKFGIPGDFSLTVDVSDPAHGYVRVNTINLLDSTPGVAADPYPWTGIYFQGIPVELQAVARPGYRFVSWQGLPDGAPAQTVQTFTTDVAVTALFEEVFEPEPLLLHYWHFNDLPSGALAEVPVDFTLLAYATITYPGTGAGYMDRVNDEGTDLNARMEQPAGRALRVRNPSAPRELLLALPTTGYQGIVLRYAVVRTTNGAQEQRLYYRTAQAADWTPFGDAQSITEDYQLFEFDFSGLAGANDNAEFAVRILFGGDSASGSSGNNRFDNISVDAMAFRSVSHFPLILGQ
jgi:hypothetical protein